MDSKKSGFDYAAFKEEAHKRLLNGGDLLGKDGALTPFLKDFLEESLSVELDVHLANETIRNRKNGKGKKQVKTSKGAVEICTPRDRVGTFDPNLIPKRQTSAGLGLKRQIITWYARGSSYNDIFDHLYEMYEVEVSTTMISRVRKSTSPAARVTQQALRRGLSDRLDRCDPLKGSSGWTRGHQDRPLHLRRK